MDRRLYQAAMLGNVEKLYEIVGGKPEILSSVTYAQRNTALHLAAKCGNVEFVSELLRLMPCLLLRSNSKQDSALHVAAMTGKTKVVEDLLKGERQVICICETPCVQLDLERPPVYGRYFWRAQNLEKNTALHIAAKEGYLAIVELMLRKDEDGLAGAMNAAGESPLFIAAKHGHLTIVKRLLKVPNSYCGMNNDGETCLHAALRGRHFDVAKEILRQRPDLAKQAYKADHFTPLHLAVWRGHVGLVKMILEKHPEECYAVGDGGRSAIHIAALSGNLDIIRELLSSNPDCIELKDGDGKTAVHLAIQSRHWKVVWYLLQNSDAPFLINEPDNEGNKILHSIMSTAPQVWLFSMPRIMMILMRMFSISRSCVNEENRECLTALDVRDSNSSGGSIYRWMLLQVGAVHGLKEPRKPRVRQESREAEAAEMDKGRPGYSFAENALERELNATRNVLSIIAVLLFTVTFSAAFTVPGGVDSKSGVAVLVDRIAFKVFVISDTLALCLSGIALHFLANPLPLTSRPLSQRMSTMLFGSAAILEGAALATLWSFALAIYLVVAPKCLPLAFIVCFMAFCTWYIRPYLLGFIPRAFIWQ